MITEYSAITLVLERAAEQLDQLPALRSVPQMLAAGWAGAVPEAEAATFQMPGADITQSMARPMPTSAPMQTAMPTPTQMPAVQTDASRTRSAPFTPKGKIRRTVDHFAGMFTGAASPKSEGVRGSQSEDELRRRELIPIVARGLSGKPELAAALAQARLSLSLLGLELPPALFNWLDGLAEAQGLDLESGAFWITLIDELCARPDGEVLRQSLGR